MAFVSSPSVVLNADDDFDNCRAYYSNGLGVVSICGTIIQTSSSAFSPGPGELVALLRRLADDLEKSWKEKWVEENEAREVDAALDDMHDGYDDGRAA